jgi:folate-binding protein YgfZ
MSPNVTFKSAKDAEPRAGPGDALTDSGGRPVALAPTLADAKREPYVPSHGHPPARMPEAPYGVLDLGPAAALRVIGPEREKWVQGMQTNDVAAAPYGGAVAASFLNGKGRLVAEGLVWRQPEELILTTIPERLEALHAHLDKLLIMEDCELSRAEGLRRVLFCPGPEPLGEHGEVTGSAQPLGLELLLPEARAKELLASLPRADPAAVERWRVALGVPAWGSELDEESTPVEAGIDREVSFDKGCYVGQEVIAMATFRGRVAWNLVRLQVDGRAPQVGDRLDERAVAGKRGRVTSALQLDGIAVLLGYVHKERMAPGSKAPLDDGREATVLGLPYGSRPGAGVCE